MFPCFSREKKSSVWKESVRELLEMKSMFTNRLCPQTNIIYWTCTGIITSAMTFQFINNTSRSLIFFFWRLTYNWRYQPSPNIGSEFCLMSVIFPPKIWGKGAFINKYGLGGRQIRGGVIFLGYFYGGSFFFRVFLWGGGHFL